VFQPVTDTVCIERRDSFTKGALLELTLGVFQIRCTLPRPRHISGFERLPERALPVHISISPNGAVAFEIVAPLIAMRTLVGVAAPNSQHGLEILSLAHPCSVKPGGRRRRNTQRQVIALVVPAGIPNLKHAGFVLEYSPHSAFIQSPQVRQFLRRIVPLERGYFASLRARAFHPELTWVDVQVAAAAAVVVTREALVKFADFAPLREV
jgi:hypothetical protein